MAMTSDATLGCSKSEPQCAPRAAHALIGGSPRSNLVYHGNELGHGVAPIPFLSPFPPLHHRFRWQGWSELN